MSTSARHPADGPDIVGPSDGTCGSTRGDVMSTSADHPSDGPVVDMLDHPMELVGPPVVAINTGRYSTSMLGHVTFKGLELRHVRDLRKILTVEKRPLREQLRRRKNTFFWKGHEQVLSVK
ncbi:hypothetical protein V499_01204 [Pseudogymnoascus sp. VKM F-103]|nr:hypothetical protein V499_01204 [Pseudogymnoascus sp. VKM F-103]